MPELVLIFIRSLLAFFVLLIMARIMGKKQISHLTFFDYCVGITIGSIAVAMSVDQNVKIANGFVSLLIWGFIPIILSYLGLKSMVIERITDGQADVLIENGKILEKNFKKSLVTISDLMLLIRENGTFNISDVEMAVLETNGKLSILLKANELPVTPKTLGIQVQPEHRPTILIIDGKILKNSIENLGITKEWLEKEVKRQGAKNIKHVFMAQIDSRGNLYIDLHEE